MLFVPLAPMLFSARGALRLSAVALVVAGCVACSGAAAAASAPPGPIRPRVTEPIVAPGGVLVIPLEARETIDRWPETLPVEVGDRTLEATVVRFERESADPRVARRWTTAPVHLRVRPIAESAAPAASSEGVHAILALPSEIDGPLRLDGWVVEPIRFAAPAIAVPDPGPPPTEPLPVVAGHDRPDPDDPFEHWRWVLLAEELGLAAPDASRFGPLEALVARHGAERWRMALARLAAESPGIARTCRRALTRRVVDDEVSLAAWVADRERTDALLQILLDPDARPGPMAEAALAWSDTVPPFLAWIEDEGGAELRLAVMNRSTRALDLELRWEEPGVPPEHLRVEPGGIARTIAARPESTRLAPAAGAAAARTLPTAAALRLTAGGATLRFVLGPSIVPAVPPGAALPLLRPRLVLLEAERGGQAPLAPDRATTAQLRHRQGRWELFIESRRAELAAPVAESADDDEPFGPGREALRVRIGTAAAPVAELAIPETGWFRLVAGTNDGSLQVHRRSLPDRWFCRVVLPDDWLRITDAAPWPAFAVERAHGDGDALEAAPAVATPWRAPIGALRCDLTWWDE